MLAKNAQPPRSATDEDLEVFEQSCRRLAARYRRKGDYATAATF